MNASTANRQAQGPEKGLVGVVDCVLPATAFESGTTPPAALPPSDAYEELRMLLRHLRAQMILISGDGLEGFDTLAADLKDSLLYGCATQTSQALVLMDAIAPSIYSVKS